MYQNKRQEKRQREWEEQDKKNNRHLESSRLWFCPRDWMSVTQSSSWSPLLLFSSFSIYLSLFIDILLHSSKTSSVFLLSSSSFSSCVNDCWSYLAIKSLLHLPELTALITTLLQDSLFSCREFLCFRVSYQFVIRLPASNNNPLVASLVGGGGSDIDPMRHPRRTRNMTRL